MIKEADLREAIAECQGERNPDAKTCMKLASYYTILEHLDGAPQMGYSYAGPADVVRYNSGSEFSEAIRDKNVDDVLAIIDELMGVLEVLAPRLYYATMDKLDS